jgi:hypothetical protein
METIMGLMFNLLAVLVVTALGFGVALVFMRFNLMKPLYRLALLGALGIVILVGLFQGRISSDRFIASELSRSPEGWRVSLDDELKSRLAPFQLDVNEQVRRALHARGEPGWASPQGLLLGFSSLAILFSLVGLYRERSLEKLRKGIEGAASAALGSGDVAA